jgi:predicted RNA binding protein YcfA (HicA-like mRNA interferase family)
MKVPRNLSSDRLIQLLANFGYETTRQTGSHIRLTTQENGQHHVTIPAHNPLKVGTLNAIFRSVAEHLSLTKDEFLEKMFGEN